MARHLITSALPHVTGVNYLDDLVGSMLPADVYARYLRCAGQEVLFVCATDEHGPHAELAAAEAGVPVERYCAQQHEILKALGERFLLSWDHFGRSSSAENHQLIHHFADSLDKNGFLEERETPQVFSPVDNRYLTDRYVLGTCPHCHYRQARGDKCDSCGASLDPTELIQPQSAISGTRDLEIRKSKQLFLRESEFDEVLGDAIDHGPSWASSGGQLATDRSNVQLRDRCITRDLDWGVPVGWPGFEGKVFDIWFDAPIEYIGATYEWSNHRYGPGSLEWRSWWFDSGDVTYTQFMTNDALPFRKLSFASTIIGSWEPWKLPDYIKGFNQLRYYGNRLSTADCSISIDAALALLPADCWRWFLTANAPESSDSLFTWESFAEVVNSDLANGFGSFIDRSFALASQAYGDQVPAGAAAGEAEHALSRSLAALLHEYTASLQTLQFTRAVGQLRAIWKLGEEYLQRTSPWQLLTTDPERCQTVLRTALNLAYVMAVISEPVIPDASAAVLRALNLPTGERWNLRSFISLDRLPAGHAYRVPGNPFREISDAELAVWRRRFGPE